MADVIKQLKTIMPDLKPRSKADPAAVARSMMCAKDSTGNVLFKSNEFLTANQKVGFFFHVLP